MLMYLANHVKPESPLFPVLISEGVTKVKQMYSKGEREAHRTTRLMANSSPKMDRTSGIL